MPKLNEEGKRMLARLEAAESSGKKLNTEGQRLLGRLRGAGVVQGVSDTERSNPEIKPPSLLEMASQSPTRTVADMFAQDPTFRGAKTIVDMPSKAIGDRLRQAISKIPDPQRQSVVANMLLGAPKAALEVGADVTEASLKPENLAMEAVPFAAIGKALGKGAGALGRVQSGVRMQAGEKLFNDPSILFAKSRKAAGEALGAVRKNLGFVEEKSASKILDDISGEKGLSFAKGVIRKIESDKPYKSAEALQALQNVQRKLEKVPFSDKSTRRELSRVAQFLSDKLGEFSGAEREASKQFSRSATASEFRRAFPVTKSGDISVGRTSFLPIMAGGGAFTGGIPAAIGLAAAQSPMLAGAEIATAGGLYKAASSILQNPKLRTAILTLLNQGGDNDSRQGR